MAHKKPIAITYNKSARAWLTNCLKVTLICTFLGILLFFPLEPLSTLFFIIASISGILSLFGIPRYYYSKHPIIVLDEYGITYKGKNILWDDIRLLKLRQAFYRSQHYTKNYETLQIHYKNNRPVVICYHDALFPITLEELIEYIKEFRPLKYDQELDIFKIKGIT